MLKSTKQLQTRLQLLRDHANDIGGVMHESEIAKVARRAAWLEPHVKYVSGNSIDDTDKAMKDLARGCDDLKKIIDSA